MANITTQDIIDNLKWDIVHKLIIDFYVDPATIKFDGDNIICTLMSNTTLNLVSESITNNYTAILNTWPRTDNSVKIDDNNYLRYMFRYDNNNVYPQLYINIIKDRIYSQYPEHIYILPYLHLIVYKSTMTKNKTKYLFGLICSAACESNSSQLRFELITYLNNLNIDDDHRFVTWMWTSRFIYDKYKYNANMYRLNRKIPDD